MTTNTHLLVSENGEPLGVVDMDAIQVAAVKFGYDLAAASNNPAELDRIVGRTLRSVGSASFGYVCASALRFVVEDLLDPVLEVAEAHGHPVRKRMAFAAEQANRDKS